MTDLHLLGAHHILSSDRWWIFNLFNFLY